MSGQCSISGKCYKNGTKNTAAACQSCNTAKSTKAWTLDTKTCLISGTCYKEGVSPKTTSCKVCTSAKSTSAWSYKAGSKQCLISDVCYADKATNPADKCGVCDAAAPTAWSTKTNFATCSVGVLNGICLAGKCCTGCYTGSGSSSKCVAGNTMAACGIEGKTCSVCKTGETCSAGKCTKLVCPTGKVDCGGKCVDITSDPLHCGKCNNPCSTGMSCSNKVCKKHPGLYLSEVHVGSDYVAIINKSGASISLSGYTIFVDDARGDSTTYDTTVKLPSQSLANGAKLYICESSSACSGTGTWNYGTNMMYTASGGGAAYLCKGTCGKTTVIDHVMYKGTSSSQAFKYGVSLKPSAVSGITSTNETTHSLVRQKFSGVYPTFYAADWKVAKKTK